MNLIASRSQVVSRLPAVSGPKAVGEYNWPGIIQAAQRAGRGCLPHFLGMTPLNYSWLGEMTDQARGPWHDHQNALEDNSQLRQELLELRRDEWDELRQLLASNRTGSDPMELLMAEVISAGCLGGEHLWRDLGFDDRSQLSACIKQYFRPLFERNNQNMKWKKFFYKQLCEQEGGYVCRAPTCQQCAAYHDCFGPED